MAVVYPEEVNDFHWISLPELNQQLRDEPEKFTVWFKMIMENYVRL
jgi:isopentenyldiphosphate isomerase